jgi:hypothetical protein
MPTFRPFATKTPYWQRPMRETHHLSPPTQAELTPYNENPRPSPLEGADQKSKKVEK